MGSNLLGTERVTKEISFSSCGIGVSESLSHNPSLSQGSIRKSQCDKGK